MIRIFLSNAIRFVGGFAVAAALLVIAPLPVEGQTITKITDHKTSFTGPGAMDDAGTTLFFASSSNQWMGNPDHGFQLFELDSASLNVLQKTNYRLGVATTQAGNDVPATAHVSGDGNWIAFVSPSDPLGTNSDLSPEIFVMSRDGVSLTQVTSDPLPNAASILRLAFSGDGNTVVFATRADLTGGNPTLLPQIYTVDRTGLNLVQRTNGLDGSFFSGLDVSDDGTRIVFGYDGNLDGTQNDDLTAEIFALELDGSLNPIRQLTDDPDDEWNSQQVVISGDGTKIAFSSEASLLGNNQNYAEIHAIDWDGSNLMQLTDTKNNISGAQGICQGTKITDDGTRIFMHSNHEGGSGENVDNNFEIFRIESDGTDWVRLTDSTLNDGSFFPVIDSDADVIAFSSFEESFDGTARAPLILPELYFIDDPDADGTAGCEINCNIRQVTTSIGGKQFDPTFKLDGSQVYFISTGNLLGGDADQGGELYRILPDGTGLTQLTEFSSADDLRSPTIPSDASRIAFLSNADPLGLNPDESLELFIIDASGDASTLDQLTDGPDNTIINAPVFYDDGTKVLFHTAQDAAGTLNNGGNDEIFVVEPDGTLNTVTQLTEVNAGNSRFPRIDASGTWIVFQSTANFVSANGDGSQEIYRMMSDGSVIEQLTDIDGTAQAAFGPDITGDGSMIAFATNESFDGTANADENFEIWIWDRATTTLHQLTDTDQGSSGSVRFSRNGDFLYFTTSAGDLVEEDPDRPFHWMRADLRNGLANVTFERVGGFETGLPFQIFPDQTGQMIILSGQGSPIYSNPDGLDELWLVDETVPVKGLTLSGKATTSLAWTQQSGPMRYDVIRGSVANLAFGMGVIDLGVVDCIAPDVKDTSTGPTGQDDPTLPLPGQAFFYTYRGDQGANLPTGTYGESSGGLERVPSVGDCVQ